MADGNRYAGRFPQVPGVFSQGATLAELEENLRDAYLMMRKEQPSPGAERVETKDVEVPA